MNNKATRSNLSTRRFTTIGIFWLVALLLGFGCWMIFANLSGATIAKGRLSESNNSHEIQHLTGGLVTAITVTEGEAVGRGSVLLRLDDRQVKADLTAVKTRIFEIGARRGRLLAERDGSDSVTFDPILIQQGRANPNLATALEGQSRLYAARVKSWRQEEQALGQKVIQVSLLAQGISAQIDAYQSQLTLVHNALIDLQKLRAKGLVPVSRLSALKQEIASIGGKISVARSQHAKTQVEISEIRLEILRQHSTRREMAIEQLRDLEFRQNELMEERRVLEGRHANLILHAPINGVVLGLGSISEHNVIEPAQVLMRIVPQDRKFIVKARISPDQISKVYLGQPVRLVFPNQSSTRDGNLQGVVSQISADTLFEPAAQQPYFQVQVIPDQEARDEIENANNIVPGMVADLFFMTGEQPAWRYLTEPFLNYFSRAMRES